MRWSFVPQNSAAAIDVFVVFSPTGVAKLNLVQNGRVVQTLATANYGGRRNVAFEVKLENSPPFVSVSVNGTRIFDNIGGANPNLFAEGGVGLITHWAPGRFDNVEFSHTIFAPCSIAFDEFPLFALIVSGTWDTAGGTLNSTAVDSSDIERLCLQREVAESVRRLGQPGRPALQPAG
jgi:hypothetical protein